jgi:hypothetical protein
MSTPKKATMVPIFSCLVMISFKKITPAIEIMRGLEEAIMEESSALVLSIPKKRRPRERNIPVNPVRKRIGKVLASKRCFLIWMMKKGRSTIDETRKRRKR